MNGIFYKLSCKLQESNKIRASVLCFKLKARLYQNAVHSGSLKVRFHHSALHSG